MLKKLDLYSLPVEFTYHKKTRTSSLIGGFCSFLICSIISFYVYSLIIGINTTHPTIYEVKNFVHQAGEITLFPYDVSTQNDNKFKYKFFFFLAIRNGSNILIPFDESLFVPKFYIVTQKNNTLLKKNLLYTNTTSIDDIKNVFISQNLSNTITLKQIFTIKGNYGANDSSYIQFDLERCNSFTKKSCQTNESINQFITSCTFEIFIWDENFNLTSKINPIYAKLIQHHFKLDTKTKKVIEIKLSVDSLTSYEPNYPKFIDKTHTIISTLSYSQPEKYLRAQDNNILISVYLTSDNQNIDYTRIYSNIFDFLFIVGGVEYFLVGFTMLFIYTYIKHRIDESMANDFYNIIDPDKEESILKKYHIYLKERLKIFDKNYKELNNNFENDLMNRFFNEAKIKKIFPTKDKANQSPLERPLEIIIEKNIKKDSIIQLIEMKSFKKTIDNTNRSNCELNDKNSINEEENTHLSEYEVNYVELYKNRILYDIFKYEFNDKMYFSMSEVLMSCFCPWWANKKSRKRFEIFKLANTKMQLEIDFYNLIKAINDVDKLKEIFFDREQIILFDSLASVSISFSKINEEKKEKEINVKEINGNETIDEDDELTTKKNRLLKEMEMLLSNMEKKSVGNIDRLLLEYIGIDPNVITHFSTIKTNTRTNNRKSTQNNSNTSDINELSQDYINNVINKFK